MNHRLIHDHALAAAQAHSDMVSPALTASQQQEFWERSYLICTAMLESFCVQQEREDKRLLRPSRNQVNPFPGHGCPIEHLGLKERYGRTDHEGLGDVR